VPTIRLTVPTAWLPHPTVRLVTSSHTAGRSSRTNKSFIRAAESFHRTVSRQKHAKTAKNHTF
jgi:hypothetical protein